MASLALIVVFYPVTFFEGLGKFLFTPMAISVAVTEIISYFAVMTMVPLLASKLLKSKAEHAHHHGRGEPVGKFSTSGSTPFKASYMAIARLGARKPAVIVALSCIGALRLRFCLDSACWARSSSLRAITGSFLSA